MLESRDITVPAELAGFQIDPDSLVVDEDCLWLTGIKNLGPVHPERRDQVAGLFKSTDQGETWSFHPLKLTVWQQALPRGSVSWPPYSIDRIQLTSGYPQIFFTDPWVMDGSCFHWRADYHRDSASWRMTKIGHY